MNEKLTILLVEDDPITTMLVKRVFSAFSVSEFVSRPNGREGLDYLIDRRTQSLPFPEIILLDLNMPVLDGWGFLDGFRDNLCTDGLDIDIYICTSSNAPEDLMKAKEFSFVREFITKPLTVNMLSTLLEKRRQGAPHLKNISQ